MKSSSTAQTATKKQSGSGAAAPAAKQNGAAAKKSASQTSSKKSSSSSEEAQALRDLFEDSLKDIYWAEKALVKALPKMAKKATTEELVTALQEHLAVTQGQVARLEQVFEALGKPPRAKKCEAMEGLIKEGESIMEETAEGVVRDAGIILAGQKIEHYEIATYGTLVAFAKILGEDEVASLFEQTLNEEKEADSNLTLIAESSINIQAAEGDENSESDDAEADEEV